MNSEQMELETVKNLLNSIYDTLKHIESTLMELEKLQSNKSNEEFYNQHSGYFTV